MSQLQRNRVFFTILIALFSVCVAIHVNQNEVAWLTFPPLFQDSVTGRISIFRRLADALSDGESSITHHKDLFPLDSSDIWGTILVTLGLLIAASGGIGGGGILVPLLILVFGFSPKHAIPLSNFCIVGSSITNMWMNLEKRHPLVDRPLVDWDLILVMEPLTMAGKVFSS